MTYTIASLSVETGIAPSELLAVDRRMIDAMVMVLNDRAKAVRRASPGKRAN